MALHTDVEAEDVDAQEQEDALAKLQAVISKGSAGSLQAAMSQKGFKRILEVSRSVVKTRAQAEKKRGRFPKLLSLASRLLSDMQLNSGTSVEQCEQQWKFVMAAARYEEIGGTVSTG